MNLLELKDKQNHVNIKVVITQKDPVKEVMRGDRKLRVAHCYIEDEDHNKGYLSLWNEDVDKYELGDVIELINGFSHLYEGNVNLSSGTSGMLKKVQ